MTSQRKCAIYFSTGFGTQPMHTSYLLLISLTITIFGMTQSRQKSKLCAPTHCIATDADFKGSANEMRVRGTSNLPPGTRLGVDVYDSIGRGSTQFNEDAVTTVNRNGFFEVVLRPKAGLAFRHNLVCNVVFMPTYPRQERSV